MQARNGRAILLSFDLEEFDLPLLYGEDIGMHEQLDIGYKGLMSVLECLEKHPGVKCTFFTTAVFANTYPNIIKRIAAFHEIASHSCSNTVCYPGDLPLSKKMLESIINKPVYGIRMPQMQPITVEAINASGFTYDSSINPTWIPGRYNHLDSPVHCTIEDNVLRIPASVSRHLRLPLFWLSFKNFPYHLFKYLSNQFLQKENFLCLYFHPWEFTDISHYKVPWYTKRLSGQRLIKRLNNLITDLSSKGDFMTMHEFSTRFMHQ